MKAEPACTFLKTDQGVARVRVDLSARQWKKAYCLRAKKGEAFRATISNPQGVEPAGWVISPAGKMDGGPGGPFYRGKARETGIYEIVAAQRGQRRPGSYDLTIEIAPHS